MRAERARSSAWGSRDALFFIDPINGPLFFINRINGAARLPLFFIDRINGRTSPSRSREAAVRVRAVVLAPLPPSHVRATLPPPPPPPPTFPPRRPRPRSFGVVFGPHTGNEGMGGL